MGPELFLLYLQCNNINKINNNLKLKIMAKITRSISDVQDKVLNQFHKDSKYVSTEDAVSVAIRNSKRSKLRMRLKAAGHSEKDIQYALRGIK